MQVLAIPPFITAILYLTMGIFVLRRVRGHRDKNALAYSAWLFTTVYWQLGWAIVFSMHDTTWIPLLVRLNYTGIVFIPITFYHLFTRFLNARRDFRWLSMAYGLGVVFAVACWISNWMVDGFYTYPWGFYARAGRIHPLYLLFLTVLVARTLYLLFHARNTAEASTAERMQLKLLRWAFICYLPAAFDFLSNYGLPYYPLGFLFTLISLSLVSYAILKHHLFDIRLIVRKTLIYSAVTLVLSAIYVAILVLIARALEAWGATSNLYSSAAAAAAIAVLVHPVRSRIQRWVDRHFPRESLNQALLREATGSFVHEIKRPLVNISMPAQLALLDLEKLELEGRGSSEALSRLRERLQFILKQSHEAADKIEAIRELSMEARPTHEATDLGQILSRALAGEEGRIIKNGVTVDIAIASDLPNVLGNAHQLEVALANIIRNAAEAVRSLPNGRKVIRCSIQASSKNLEVRIADSGPGIRSKDIQHLFEPWFSTKGSQGMGIGLYLTQEIIHRHGGSIEAISDEGRGTTFRIILPLKF